VARRQRLSLTHTQTHTCAQTHTYQHSTRKESPFGRVTTVVGDRGSHEHTLSLSLIHTHIQIYTSILHKKSRLFEEPHRWQRMEVHTHSLTHSLTHAHTHVPAFCKKGVAFWQSHTGGRGQRLSRKHSMSLCLSLSPTHTYTNILKDKSRLFEEPHQSHTLPNSPTHTHTHMCVPAFYKTGVAFLKCHTSGRG